MMRLLTIYQPSQPEPFCRIILDSGVSNDYLISNLKEEYPKYKYMIEELPKAFSTFGVLEVLNNWGI